MASSKMHISPYKWELINGKIREGAHIHWHGVGDLCPLPGFSKETLQQAHDQINNLPPISSLDELNELSLYPSVHFALESAFTPLVETPWRSAALLMGTFSEIMDLTKKNWGSDTAKLKLNQCSFSEAKKLIDHLRPDFKLRIDVNKAWETEEALKFFSQYPYDAFEYVEEPFKNPRDLQAFTHPLAIDESYPSDLALEDLEKLKIKALVYKPTIQGGFSKAFPLAQWAKRRGFSFVLSSSFESLVGLARIAEMNQRLELSTLPGLGTRFYIK